MIKFEESNAASVVVVSLGRMPQNVLNLTPFFSMSFSVDHIHSFFVCACEKFPPDTGKTFAMAAVEGILYALMAQPDGTAIAEVARAKGSHAMNAKKVLQGVPKSNGDKRSYTHQRFCYNILTDAQGTIFMCVTEESFSRVTAFNFLDAIKKTCGPLKATPPAVFNQLKKEAEFYSDPKNDKITKIKSEIGAVKEVMIDNIEKILERGDKIDNLIEKTGNLEKQSGEFQSKATQLKNKMWLKQFLMKFAIAVVVLLVIFIIVFLACRDDGMNFNKCK
jgi:vesicle-associated membrane protein 7